MIKRQSKTAHQVCRSLLQKAVRRGDVSVTRSTACHLIDVGETEWLKNRAAVITFEECWPLGLELHCLTQGHDGIKQILGNIATSPKMKDAAGLGVLAYMLTRGDTTVLKGDCNDVVIEQVSKGIRTPNIFWEWAISNCSEERSRILVESAQKAFRRGGWPWDRAMMLAAAYLAVKNGVPKVEKAQQSFTEFPYWVALDKHTEQGKAALAKSAKMHKVPWRHVLWVSFYFESAITNSEVKSSWWAREIDWRLNRIGLNRIEALNLWDKVRPTIERLLCVDGRNLREHISSFPRTRCDSGAQANLKFM